MGLGVVIGLGTIVLGVMGAVVGAVVLEGAIPVEIGVRVPGPLVLKISTCYRPTDRNACR